jgi:hypothetical protein
MAWEIDEQGNELCELDTWSGEPLADPLKEDPSS